MHAFLTNAVAVSVVFACVSPAKQAAPTAAVRPLDAVAIIVDAFRNHSVVGLEEHHGDADGHAFRLSLIRDPRFAAIVDDILVEFGNSRYQDVIDRFTGGQPVPDDELRKVWQDTTQAHTIWDRPIYEDFFRAVRAVNASLPAGRRVRVLLGDPPIDWGAVRTREDIQTYFARRSAHPADVLLAEVLAKKRRALVIYGALHLWKMNLQGPNLIERVETAAGIKAFVVISHPLASLDVLGANPASWPVPSIALTAGSRLETQMDAVLYLGPASGEHTSPLSAALCADMRYREMRTRRMALAGNPRAGDVLEKECAADR